jgi:hypothetical protein
MIICKNFTSGISGLGIALFACGLRQAPEETDAFLVTVTKDMQDTKIHRYYTT